MRVLPAILALLLASPALCDPSACTQGISRETTERVFNTLKPAAQEGDCRFEGVQTERTRLVARWSVADGPLPPIVIVPRECAPDGAQRSGAFVIDVPAELAQRCPAVVARLATIKQLVASETPAGRHGSESDPLFRGVRLLFVAFGVSVLGLTLRAIQRWRSLDPRWLATAVVGFAGALVVRTVLPFTLGNWYSEVLPASGPPPWMRFGSGFFAAQSLLRDAGLWNSRTLMWTQILLGAAAAPLLIAVMRELRMSWPASTAAVVLLVLDPFHARLSATTSEHVMASTLCLAFLLAWLRAARNDRLWFQTAVLLLFLVGATRVDMALQAGCVLVWPLLRDGIEVRTGATRPRFGMIIVMAIIALLAFAAIYWLIALPSRHPMPDTDWFRYALRYFVPQYWWLATTDPHWMSLSSVLLASVGLLAMVLQRPLLFLRIGATLLVAFVVSGHTFMHDELVGARYFIFIIPVFLMVSGYGFATLLALVPPQSRMIATAIGLAGLALWTGFAARTAYAARYTFQDEYSFARVALRDLPAGCTVFQERIRADALPGDLDCCLDLGRSPLVLDFPGLRFVDLPNNREGVVSGATCTAYYEGTACEIVPAADRPGYQFAHEADAYFEPRCAAARELGELQLLSEATMSPRSTRDLFADKPPRARLYRLGSPER